MSRGGRGGARGGGRAGGPELPFELDGDLDDLMAFNRRNAAEDDDDWLKTLYPPMQPPRRPSPTPEDRRLVAEWRELREARRKGPFFIDVPITGKRDPADFNAFEDVATYGNKRIKRARGLPNLKKVPFVKELMPKELWSVFTDEDVEGGENAPTAKKDLNFLKKKRLDRLAQFDEGAEETTAAEAEDDEANENEDGEEGVEIPEDDEFSETDNDEGDDYNAEKYFDNDEGPDDDGDEGGGEEAW